MAPPRRVVPGKSYFITRRSCQRTFRLRPHRVTSQVFQYALGLAAQKTGVVIHAVCVMSNHHHTVVTDPEGRLPEFAAELHRMVAQALNAAHGLRENLWNSDRTVATEIADIRALIERIAYTATNPVSAGLVEKPEQWPGVSFWMPTRFRVARPDPFFSEHGKCPEFVEVRIEKPGWLGMSAREWAQAIDAAVSCRAHTAREAIFAQGRRFLGRAAVLSTSFLAKARSLETKRERVPVVAASDPETKARVVEEVKVFRIAHRDAMNRWRDGYRDAVFPLGTWAMRRVHNAKVVQPLTRAMAGLSSALATAQAQ